MSIEQKVEAAKKKLNQEELKTRKLTWRERFGTFPILWIFLIGVITGAIWTFVLINAPKMFEVKTIVIVNTAEAKEIEPTQIEETVVQLNSDTNRIADIIWTKESSRGINNYSKCEAVGQVNGIGYGIPGNGKYQCFESHEEEMEVLNKWIEDHKAQGMSETELMCHYSGSNYSLCKV